MLFMIHCLDRPDAGTLRADTRPRHLDYLEGKGEAVRIAGPILGDDGDTVEGSLLLVDVADRAAAEAIAKADPYAEAGLFQSVTIWGWRKVVARPLDD